MCPRTIPEQGGFLMLFMTEPVKLSSIDDTDTINLHFCLEMQLAEYMYDSLVSKPREDDHRPRGYNISYGFELDEWQTSAREWFKSNGYELSPVVMVSYMFDHEGVTYGRLILSELNKHIPIINKLVKI